MYGVIAPYTYARTIFHTTKHAQQYHMDVINNRHLLQMATLMFVYYIIMTHIYNKVDMIMKVDFI